MHLPQATLVYYELTLEQKPDCTGRECTRTSENMSPLATFTSVTNSQPNLPLPCFSHYHLLQPLSTGLVWTSWGSSQLRLLGTDGFA